MKFESYTKEQLAAILEALNPDTQKVLEALHTNPTDEMKRITDAIHGLFCNAPHTEESDEYCPYFEEDQIANTWSQPAHQAWLQQSLSLLEKFHISGEKELSRLINKVGKVKGMFKEEELDFLLFSLQFTQTASDEV